MNLPTWGLYLEESEKEEHAVVCMEVVSCLRKKSPDGDRASEVHVSADLSF